MGNGKGPTTDLTLRDIEQTRTLPTGQIHTFRVRPFSGKILEVEDIHFHHDSAVMLPDSGDLPGLQDPADENHISGLDVLRACYLHAQRMPSNLALIAGHTDRSGKDDYNLTLSQLRADNVFFLLMGNKKAWVDSCHEKHKTEDIQQILIWVTAVIGWPCDPGTKNNQKNGKTVAAIRTFQGTYNEKFSAKIGVDGDVGKETWGAIYDVYMMKLREIMKTDDAGLERLRSGIKYVDDSKKSVGCGENFPITEDLVANQKSRVDRRVHILFFDPPDVPKLDCHPKAGACEAAVCELYGSNRIYTFKPLPKEPEAIARNFRVRLEYGEIDWLFKPIASPVPTDMGLLTRLQAVGFIYELLSAGNTKKVAPVAWEHFKNQEGASSDAVAAERLKDMLKEVVLDNNVLPDPGAFGKIRLPGTWCALNGVNENPPETPPHYRYFQEDITWSDNPGLGLIPIVAVVEQEKSGTWGPAPKGLQVHFQLIPPDEVPADNAPPPLRSTPLVSEMGVATFNMTGSPKAYVDAAKARNPVTAGDPMADNVHMKAGGKRGNPIAGGDRAKNVLQSGVTHKGFHDHFSFDVPKNSSHPNAVAAKTNDQGKAAVILMPARTGGDRYKLRVFLDPIPEPGADQASNGTEELAVKAETGTLVVWRILRFSKYLRWDYPGPGVDANDAAHRKVCGGALNDFDITGFIAKEFRKAWFDVTVEAAAQAPQKISQAEWRNAILFARGVTAKTTTGQAYDMAALVPDTTSTPGVHNDNPGLIRFHTAAQYNARKAAKFPAAPAQAKFFADMATIMHRMKEEIMEYFTRNALAGMTVIQVPLMSSVETDTPTATLNALTGRDWKRSGWGGFRRGCYVAYGSEMYKAPIFTYDHNRNTMHEFGHTLYCTHQYEFPAWVSDGTKGVTTGGIAQHDFHDLCIMGYMATWPGGDFCGRCLLMFGGWDTNGIPKNSPGL